MTSELEQLPDEIILKIITYVRVHRFPRLKEMRMLSKMFHDLVTPNLFVSFTSGARSNSVITLGWCRAILSDLSAHKTTVFEHTRNLNINFDRSSFTDEEMEVLVKLWTSLLSVMRNLSSMTLEAAGISSHSTHRINKFVRDASIQQHLKEFNLIVRSAHLPLEFSLQPLSDLHTFSFSWSLFKGLDPQLTIEISNLLGRCPNLEVLCLGMMSTLIKDTQKADKPQSLEELLEGWSTMENPLRLRRLIIRGVVICSRDFTSNIRHLKSLQDLTIELYPTPNELGSIFAILRTEGIHLRNISVMALHPPEIIDYISSFTGLEGFSIESYDIRDDSRSLIHGLFSVLKQHCITLKSLRININRISPWQEIPRSHLLENAELFRSLETLEIRVHTSLEDAQADNAEVLLAWLEIAMRFPTLSQLKIKPVKWKTGEYSFPHNRDDMVEPGWKIVPAFREKILREFRREREFTFDIIYFKY